MANKVQMINKEDAQALGLFTSEQIERALQTDTGFIASVDGIDYHIQNMDLDFRTGARTVNLRPGPREDWNKRM